MIDVTQFEDDLVVILGGLSGITTIISHPSAPRPPTPYLVFELRDFTQLGRGDHSDVDELGIATTISDYEMNVAVQVIGPNSRSTATAIRSSLNKYPVLMEFMEAGMAYSRATPVRHIPQILETNWEERAIFEIQFFISDIDSTEHGFITNTTVTSCYSFYPFNDYPEDLPPFVMAGDTSGLGLSSIGEPCEGGALIINLDQNVFTRTLIINADFLLCP